MVYQQNSTFDGGGLWDPGSWLPQGRGRVPTDSLRSMNYEEGRRSLSARDSSSREIEPLTPTQSPYESGAWELFGEDQRKSIRGRFRNEDSPVGGPCSWIQLCDFLGLHPGFLGAFNPEESGPMDRILQEDVIVYVPSAEELAFWNLAQEMQIPLSAPELRDEAESVFLSEPSLVSIFSERMRSGAVDVVASARDRAAGRTGGGYGVEAGRFYSRNRALKGGRGRRSVDGVRERVIAWGEGNKCNVFVGDSFDQAGLKTPVSSNGHYPTAGNLFARYSSKEEESPRKRHVFREVAREELRMGDIFVRNGGRGADMSHTEVITSAPDSGSFFAVGAHYEGAYEIQYFTDESAYEEKVLSLAGDEAIQELEMDDFGERNRLRYIEPSDYHFLRHQALGRAL